MNLRGGRPKSSQSAGGKELGSILTDYCLEIAAKWNLKRIVAQTTTDNSRMISVFKKRGSRSGMTPRSTS